MAIKLPMGDWTAREGRERFLREALAVGRLVHPHIVPIHGVGEAQGRPYLVMPLINGRTLAEQPLALRPTLEAIRDVAQAVDYAHRQGLVHRDLKPGNLMLDETGCVFVVDFGLAALIGDARSSVTEPGTALGTAAYMSPEQARGDAWARDPATDIYALGATLFHLVTGAPPFQAESFAGIVYKVIHDDPLPLRRVAPDLSPALEAVIGKAMEKDVARRYSSAQALADDLQRLLDGQPIEARPEPLLDRLARRVRSRPLAWAGAAVLVALVAALGLARVRLEHERHASLQALREMARLSLDTALRLRRAGDAAGMRRLLPELVSAYQRMSARGTPTADVEYLMARMYRAEFDDPEALAHAQRALAQDPGFAPALYEHAVLTSNQYRRDLDDAAVDLRGGFPLDTADLVRAAERAHPGLVETRRRVEEDCERLASLPVGRATAAAARGILAYQQHQLGQARDQLQQALAAEPLIEEAWQTLAQAEEADGHLDRAEAAYTRGLALDRGYAPHLIGRAKLRSHHLQFDAAIADATAALALDPGSFDALFTRAKAAIPLGHDRVMRGQDGFALFAAAERDLRAVLGSRDPGMILMYLAKAHRYRGIQHARRAQDPTPDFDAAQADLGRALGLDPKRVQFWSERGRTRTRHGAYLLHIGQDPMPVFVAAAADLDEAARIYDGNNEVWAYRADLLAHRGLAAIDHGDLAEQDFAASEQCFARAERYGYATGGWLYFFRGAMRTWRGLARARAGGDPLGDWSAAEKDLIDAKRQQPDYTDPLVALARLRLERGLFLKGRRRRGADEDLGAAAMDLDRALAIDPQLAEAREARARLAAAMTR